MTAVIYADRFDPPTRRQRRISRLAMTSIQPELFMVLPFAQDGGERAELCKSCFGKKIAVVEECIGSGTQADYVKLLSELRCRYRIEKLVLLLEYESPGSFDLVNRLKDAVDCAVFVADNKEPAQIEALKLSCAIPASILPCEERAGKKEWVQELLTQRRGREYLTDRVYSEIIRHRYYSAKPDLDWLREKSEAYHNEKRIAHVHGCEYEAVRLAKRWGADTETAAEAAILHDITKKRKYPEQLRLCQKYDIVNDIGELENPAILHAKTGAAFAREHYGVSDEVFCAIRWHTTAKPDMSMMEKILYLADYIEPTRDFPGVERLREAAYQDIDAAMCLGLEMSILDIRARGYEPYKDTINAYRWYAEKRR